MTDTTDADYWRGSYNNRGALNHIVFDPTASDTRPKLSGVTVTGISIQQS